MEIYTFNELFLKQIEGTQKMYLDYVLKPDDKRGPLARETLEALIALQEILSREIIEVYKVYDKQKKGIPNE